MVEFLFGERIARGARLRVACTAAIKRNGAVLLTKRRDNGLWCMPAGALDAGESVAEACEREVLEETGLVVIAARLIGVYSTPHRVTVYPDNRWHVIDLLFSAREVGGTLCVTPETTAFGFFTMKEAEALDLMAHDRERLRDAFAGRQTIVR